MSRGYLFDCATNTVYLNNNAYAKFKNSSDFVVVRTKENLVERYGLMGLVDVATKLGITVDDSWTSKELCESVWNKFKEITDGNIRDERRAKRAASAKDSGPSRGRGNHTTGPRRTRQPRDYKICFQAISEELRPTAQSRLPLQARTILDRLRSQSLEVLTEEQMMQAVQQMADDGHLVGRKRADGTNDPLGQSPWRIFSYYESVFHNRNFVVRVMKREYKSKED